MNTFFRFALAVCTCAALPLAHAAEFDDYARVIRVTPRVQELNEPREVCRTDYQHIERRERSAGGAVIGGVAGALLGSRFGRGDGRTASTAAGAILGAMVGDRAASRDGDVEHYEQPVRRCELRDNWVSRTDGFDVDYEYRGRQYSIVTDREPGDRLPVRVSVVPAL
jgi:uncharacterized protein YcfJ